MRADDLPCEEARRLLWPDPANPASATARAHFDRCPDCQRFFALDRELEARLARLPRSEAPPELRTRVAAAIARERRRRATRRWTAVAVLATAAVLALATGLRMRPPVPRIAPPFVARVTEPRAAVMTLASANAAEVETWLAERLGAPVTVPGIAEATLMGGGMTDVAGHPAAVAFYEMHGMPLTYFALREIRLDDQELGIADMLTDGDQGYEVAVWRETDGLRAVAAPMPRETVRQVADECRRRSTRTLP
jgi:anti-sigma factor RsiW